ncbi:DNA-directed RNA polymerase III subunit RPC8, partial [Tremellales sp. Uapishka_1]
MFILIGIKASTRWFANKLIPDRGLALSVYDILTAEDGKVTWGNGLMYYKVSFRLMVFAPFVGEVIVGKVLSTSPDYIRVSVGFFRDIYVIPSLLPPNSAYDPNQKSFFWVSTDDDEILDAAQLMNTEMTSRLYIDPGEFMRFRVDSVEWQESEPVPPSIRDKPKDVVEGEEIVEVDTKGPIERAGYKILATIAESGLGVCSWWDVQEEAEEGMEED